MPFHPLAYICQWKYWEQLFSFIWRWPLLLFADFLDLHFGFGVLNIMVWPPLCWKRGLWESWLSLFSSIKGGIRFHCLTRHFLISLAWLSMVLSLGNKRRDSTKDSWQGHSSSLLLVTYKWESFYPLWSEEYRFKKYSKFIVLGIY